MALDGRDFYEDQSARIPIVARGRRLHAQAGYIEADRFRPSKQKRLLTGGGPYIAPAQPGNPAASLRDFVSGVHNRDRDWETRAGTVEHRIPKLRSRL
jgi:hypothetical protein